MYSQRGGMAWQIESIAMTTNAHGEVMRNLGRMFTGESIFMNTFTSNADGDPVETVKSLGNILLGGNRHHK